jgi:hypothetical protein
MHASRYEWLLVFLARSPRKVDFEYSLHRCLFTTAQPLPCRNAYVRLEYTGYSIVFSVAVFLYTGSHPFSYANNGNRGVSDFILAAWQHVPIVIKRRRSHVRRMLRPMYVD